MANLLWTVAIAIVVVWLAVQLMRDESKEKDLAGA